MGKNKRNESCRVTKLCETGLNNSVIGDLYHETVLFHVAAGTVDDLLLAQVFASRLLRHGHALACLLLAAVHL